MIRSVLVSLAAAGSVPAAASRPPAPHPPGCTVYGEVNVDVVSPRDSNKGLPGVR